MSLDHLLTRFDASLPVFERNAYAQVTIDLPRDAPLHLGWERVRSWARQHFPVERSLAAILILHAPHLALSANAPHIHVIVPARRLGANGFGEHARDVNSDEGHRDALGSWLATAK